MDIRHSLKLQPDDWRRLTELAADTNSFYSKKPSWRRLILRIARGDLIIREASHSAMFKNSLNRPAGRKWLVPPTDFLHQ